MIKIGGNENTITHLKLSPNNKLLIGFTFEKERNDEEVKEMEQNNYNFICKIWNLETKLLLHSEVLVIDNNDRYLLEDPHKLIFITSDSSFLLMRSDDKKGINILNLEDMSVIENLVSLHR